MTAGTVPGDGPVGMGRWGWTGGDGPVGMDRWGWTGGDGPEGRAGRAREEREDRRGGAGGNRTRDLLNAIQALSQLSYGPTQRPRLPRPTRGVKDVSTSGPEIRSGVGYARPPAGVAKLVYAGDSKSPGHQAVRVRVPPPAPRVPSPGRGFISVPTRTKKRGEYAKF